MKISIITTVYNAESTLPRLLDSMVAHKSPVLEFFLIDNGSQDGSNEICREYVKKDRRFKIYSLNDNIGYIRARNLGLKLVDGEHVGFCDSDDFLEPGGYDRAVEVIVKTQCDFYLAAYNIVSGETVVKCRPPYKAGLYQSDDVQETILPQTFGPLPNRGCLHGFAWKQIIRSRIVRENNFSFLESLQPYEDQLFNTDVIRKCRTVYVDDSVLYNYVANQESITARQVADFDPEHERERIVSLYAEKKKRVLRAIEREACCNQSLVGIYSCILMIVKQSSGIIDTAKTIKRLFNDNVTAEIIAGSSRLVSSKSGFTRLCLRLRLFLTLSFCIKTALRLGRR